MSFAYDIKTKCNEYVNFAIGGIQLPYKLGAKNTPSQILNSINAWKGNSYKTITEIQTWVNNNKDKTGIDCSGLVYYVLNEASKNAVFPVTPPIPADTSGLGVVRRWFQIKLNISDLPYSYGISASNLTNTSYSNKITKAKYMIPGCTIRSDNGGHVLVIYEVEKNTSGIVTKIRYAHSNGSKGPHLGYINIGNENEDLNSSSQTWYDTAYTSSQAKSLYNYTAHLHCLLDLF